MTQQKQLFQKAQNALAAGNTKQAEKQLKKLLKARELFVPVRILLSKVYVAQGRIKAAAESLAEAANQQADNVTLQKAAGDMYAKIGAYQDAVRHLELAVAKQPENPDLWQSLLKSLLESYRQSPAKSQQNLDDLLALSTKAIELFPTNLDLIHTAGEICFSANLLEPATQYLEACLGSTPPNMSAHHRWLEIHHLQENYGPIRVYAERFAETIVSDPLCNRVIATAYEKNGQVDVAERFVDRALKLAPNNAEYVASKGRVLYHLGQFEQSLDYLNQSITLDETLIAPRANRCLVQKKLGNIAAAAIDEPFRLLVPDDNPKFDLKVPLWDGSPLGNRRLFIWSDQGVGDVFKYALLIHNLDYEKDQIILCAQAKLVPFLKQVFPKIDVRPFPVYRTPPLPSRETRVSPIFDAIEEDFDCHVPIGFLYRHLRPTLASFRERASNYQLNDQIVSQFWNMEILDHPGKTKVGIAWSSKKRNPLIERNYLSMEDLLPLLRLPNFVFYNFQYDVAEEEIDQFRTTHDVPFYHAPGLDLFDDLLGTAAFNMCMDLFVSPASTCSDIAGSMGIPSLRIDLAHLPENLGQDYVPWYRNQASLSIPYEKSIHDFFPKMKSWLLENKKH